MPTNKDFKRLVRARMRKTGESYTTARAHLLAKKQVTKSKTFAASVSRLYRAWSDAGARARWLPAVDLTVRTATRDKSMRITWPDMTSVQVGFAARSGAKSQVQVQHAKLPDRQASTRMKQFWAERLGALEAVLAPR